MAAFARMFSSRSNLRHLGPLLRAVLEPRKPRHRVLRVALGVAGVLLLAVLVVVGIAVGAVMLVLGLGYRLLNPKRPASRSSRIVDAEYRVVSRPALQSR